MLKITNLTNGILFLSNGIRFKRSETKEFQEDTNLLSELNTLFLEQKIQIEHIPDLSKPVELSALVEPIKIEIPVKKENKKHSKFRRSW